MKRTSAAIKSVVSLLLAAVLLLSTVPSGYATFTHGALEVGDTIFFGDYEQNGRAGDGAEPLEWIVLENDGRTAVLITRYVIDCVKYNNTHRAVTWEDSDIRQWLNDDFYNTAFSATEQLAILSNVTYADCNPDYNTDPGYDTHDNVFLLSVDEAYDYFDSNGERNCMPTAYAIKRGALVNKDKKGCWWWLRTPGKTAKEAAYVIGGGSAYGKSAPVNNIHGAVRPAVRVLLSHFA